VTARLAEIRRRKAELVAKSDEDRAILGHAALALAGPLAITDVARQAYADARTPPPVITLGERLLRAFVAPAAGIALRWGWVGFVTARAARVALLLARRSDAALPGG
jgi:hypothetical protein